MPAVGRRRTVFLTTLTLVAVVVPLGALVAELRGDRVRRDSQPSIADVLERIPLGFEANQGRYGSEVRFVARAPGHTVLLTPEGLVVSVGGGASSPVAIRLDGARPDPEISGGQPLSARSNQFLGADRNRWQTEVPTYRSVSYADVYPGIDLVFYGRARHVEHDFVLAPGADPGAIRLAVSGATGRYLDRTGDLVLPAGTDEVRLRAPQLYQDVDGRRRPVEGRFHEHPDGRIGFAVGTYDRSRPLVIDPVVETASYLGGTGTETAYGAAVDVDGNIVVAGYTESSDFPTVSPAQASLVQNEGARTDVFVTKVKADGTTVLWSTYLGGRGRDAALAVAVGGDGGVYLTGYTESPDFPTNRALQAANAGGPNDVFVAKLNSAGSALEYATYLGGKGAETGAGIAVDAAGAAYVAGHTGSSDFPTMAPFQGALARPDDLDGFVAKIQPGGAGLAYSSYLGGGGDDHLTDVAVDGEGSAHVVGDTRAADFPTVRPFQPALGGAAAGGNFSDAIVAKVRPDGSGLAYGSFLGGTDADKATALALDGQGNAYVTGNTGSNTFPVVSAFQSKKDGDFDAFVTKLKADGNVAYSSFLGGSGSDGGEGVAVDRQGRAFVSGATASTNFPTSSALQGEKAGGFVDAFLSHVSANGQSLVSSSYLGGRDDDQSAAITIDGEGHLAVVGYTNSADFPTARPFQAQKAGGVGDAFVVKIRADTAADASGGPAASKRERRLRLLVTVTGGLLMAAALHTLWLRRKPAPREQPEPAPTGREVEVPGLQYVPRRGRAPAGRTPSGGYAWSEPTKSADWDRRQPVGVVARGDGVDEEEEPARRRPRSTPAWDEPQRPLLRPLERLPQRRGTSGVATPDLWESDGPPGDATSGAATGPDEVEDGGDVDEWEVEPGLAGNTAVGLDPMDVWGPLAVEQDPDQWADECGVTDLLQAGELSAAVPGAPGTAGEARHGPDATEWPVDLAAQAEREAAEAARRAADAQRAVQEAAAAEAAARRAAELAEREAAELAAREAAELTVKDPAELAARGPEEEARAAEEAELAAREAAEVWGPDAAMEPVPSAEDHAEPELGETAGPDGVDAAAAERRAAAERAALHEAIRKAVEREAEALREAAEARSRQAAQASPQPADTSHAEQEAAKLAASQAAELEGVAQSRAEAAQAAQQARMAAQAEAAEATQRAEAAQAEARAAAQAAALQAALAAFEAAEAEAARIAEADAARLAAQVAAQVAEAHAARIAAEAAAAAEAEAEARARAERQLEAERQAAEAAEAAARAQADAEARAAAAVAAAREARTRAEAPASPAQPPPSERPAGWNETVARAEALAEEARAAEARAAEAAELAELAEILEREAAEAAELAEREAAEAREAEARAAERAARPQRATEDRTAERQAAEARAAEARAAEARAAAARAAQERAAEARAAEARVAEARAVEARAAQARAAEARAAAARAQEEARAAEEARVAAARAAEEARAAAARAEEEARVAAARAQEEARAAAARRAQGRRTERPRPAVAGRRSAAPQPPSPVPPQPPRGGHRDFSLSELLDEDLPIPEPVAGQPREERDRRWLDRVLDEEFAPAEGPPPVQPVAPPPNPSGIVGGTTLPPEGPEEEPAVVLPPPPRRLLANLFEPDPDDPLVQSTGSHRDTGSEEP